MSEQIKPVAWIKGLIGAEAKQSGECYDLVFCETLGYSPIYSAETVQQLQDKVSQLKDALEWEEIAHHAERNKARAEENENTLLRDKVQQLQQHKDRLLAALKDARDWIDKNNFGGCDTFALLEKIDAIIAEAGGKV